MNIDPRSELKQIGRGDSYKNTLTRLYALRTGPQTIVEVGTTRGVFGGGPRGDGWATLAWAWYCQKFGGHIHTIDIDQRCIDECRNLTTPYADVVSYHTMTGVEFLKNFEGTIDLLYLDGSDAVHEMCEEYYTAKPHLTEKTLILLDDIPKDYLKYDRED